MSPSRPAFAPVMALLLTLAAAPAAVADDWIHYGGDEGGSHYSPLSEINRENVGRLQLAWSYQTGDIARHPASQVIFPLPVTVTTEDRSPFTFRAPFEDPGAPRLRSAHAPPELR